MVYHQPYITGLVGPHHLVNEQGPNPAILFAQLVVNHWPYMLPPSVALVLVKPAMSLLMVQKSQQST